MKNSYLKFLNHASFLVESNDSIILVDPWFSGSAFNNGWSLLDNFIKEEELIEEIKNSKKQLFIWYSHEHSDHLTDAREVSLSITPPRGDQPRDQ